MASQLATPQSINLMLDFRPASLPLLSASVISKDMTEASSTDVKDSTGLQSSHAVWTRLPCTCKTSQVAQRVIGAITRGVGMATGGIDVDDIDGPRKRTR
jgi:hypothetical protein